MAATAPTFIWYELMTNDTDAAKAFYGPVVGWEPQDLPPPHDGYSLFNAAGRGVAGLMALPDEARAQGARPGWMGYVSVPDTDAGAARIEAAGGRILRAPADIPEVGRFAVVADPSGAVFMLMTPAPRDEAPPPPPARMTPGHVGWHELYAEDGVAALRFYGEQFGWHEVSAMDMGPMGTYFLWAAEGDEAIGGMMTRPPEVPQSSWQYYFVVDGIDAAAERIRANGGQVVHGPMEVPDGSWIVMGSDAQGTPFALVSATK
jgi:predicted enzyme related to lactoylglutathione lyase